MTKIWGIVATATAAALGLSGLAFAQSNKLGDHGRDTARSGTASSLTTPQVAALVKHVKYSLSDSISAAERQCTGRAVRAECGRGADGGAVCVVTLLVGDNRLVEATVNTQSGAVVGQHDVDTLSFSGLTRDGAASGDDVAMARRWQKVTDLRGKKVTNAAGEDLGQIEELVADANVGRVLYGVLSFGGLLGVGDKLFAIPWPALRLADDGKAFILNVEKDRLTNATGFAKDHWPDLADEQFAVTTYKYYDQMPYWQAQTDDVRQEAYERAGGSSDNYRTRWNQRMTAWQKSSDLCGKVVRTAQTDDVGRLSDLAIDPDSGRILSGILSYRDRLFAIPWSALALNSDAKHFVLSVEEAQLTDAVSFRDDDWPNLVDQRWATDLYAHYNVEPYWAVRTLQRGAKNP
jgi:sporulation protein YlmC with PRC-barrel domain